MQKIWMKMNALFVLGFVLQLEVNSSPGAVVISTGRSSLGQPMSSRLCVGSRIRLAEGSRVLSYRQPIGQTGSSKRLGDPPVSLSPVGTTFSIKTRGEKKQPPDGGLAGKKGGNLSCFTGIKIHTEPQIRAVFSGAPSRYVPSAFVVTLADSLTALRHPGVKWHQNSSCSAFFLPCSWAFWLLTDLCCCVLCLIHCCYTVWRENTHSGFCAPSLWNEKTPLACWPGSKRTACSKNIYNIHVT